MMEGMSMKSHLKDLLEMNLPLLCTQMVLFQHYPENNNKRQGNGLHRQHHRRILESIAEKSSGIPYACKSILKEKQICKEDYDDVWREIQIMHHLSEHPNVEWQGFVDRRNGKALLIGLQITGTLRWIANQLRGNSHTGFGVHKIARCWKSNFDLMFTKY
ncbi:Calcium dependent protein kinase [Abeliophyllum distichum]|uniref:Calcium dependent protein kinase n=1 Tax=Abeliophyllum distichum TaxID=126358 RepID=A0ABD1P9H0_9LAMI